MNDLKIKDMGEALKSHYASKSLSNNQLNELLDLQEVNFSSQRLTNLEKEMKSSSRDYPKSTTEGWQRFLPNAQNYRYAFYVTAFMLLGCLFAVYSLLDRAPLSQRIMSEIVYNHNQDMPIEIASSSLTDISDYLDKLSFSIVLPDALSQPNWQLLGGRYCSINGKLAAQLKVKNLKDNSTYTFYQAAIDKKLNKPGAASMTDTIDGVGVSIWREQGLLLGLAREKSVFIK